MRRPQLRIVASAVLAGGLLAAGAGPALAQADEGRIVRIDSADGAIQLVFEAANLPEGVGIDPESVTLTINEALAEPTVEPVGDRVTRRVLLVIDISGSMEGQPLDSAKQAAAAFLDTVPEDVEVGLISFDDEVSLLEAPTTDRARVAVAVDALEVGGDTALYDAIGLGLTTLAEGDVRQMVVLSDGEDTASAATLDETIAAIGDTGAAGAGVTVDAVTFQDSDVIETLQALTEAGGGRLVTVTDAEDLTELFTASAEVIASQLLITAQLPEGTVSGQATVHVEATVAGRLIEDTVVALVDVPPPPTPAAPTAPPPRAVETAEPWMDPQLMLRVAAGLVFVAILIAVGLTMGSVARSRREARFQRRFAAYTLTGRRPGAAASVPGVAVGSGQHARPALLGDSAVARTAIELASRVVARKGWDERIQKVLVAAGLPLRAGEWVVLHVGAAVGPALLLLALSGGDWLIPILGFALGAIAPAVVLSHRRAARRRRFDEHLPETLQLIAGSLAAGHSLPQAVETAAQESPDPLAGEFTRAIVETRLGVPIEDALDHLAERAESKDFAWVVMAIRIHREVGGNLAELLTTVAGTLRERERLRRQVLVLSAEGRLSAVILGLLPLVFTLYLVSVRRSYLNVLFTDPLGVTMLLGALVLLVVGIVWMRRLVHVEV